MHLPRPILFALALACSCSSAETSMPLGSEPHGTGPSGKEPSGPELLYVSPEALTLAPGRERWLSVSSLIQVSPTSGQTVPPRVTVSSSDPSVASVSSDTVGWVHVVARATGVATISVRSLRAGQATKSSTITVRSAPVGNEAGLVYSASARLLPSRTYFPGAEAALGPSELDVSVVISNPMTSARDIWLSGCGVWIRIVPTADLGARATDEVPRGMQCMASDRHVTLAPGASDTIVATGVGFGYGRDTLTTGRYYVVAALDRVRDLINLPAGPVDFVSPNSGLIFAATTSVAGELLQVHASLTNSNAGAVHLEYGACAVSLLAFRTPDRTGTPAWNSDYRGQYGYPNSGYGCPAYLAIGSVKPGETVSPTELNPAFAVMDMLGDSLANGHYYFTAKIGMNGRVTPVAAGDAQVSR